MAGGRESEVGLGRRVGDRLAGWRRAGLAFRMGVGAAGLAVVAIVVGIALLLVEGSLASIDRFGLGFLTGSLWDVPIGRFGAWPAVAGTLLVSGLALLLAVPVALGVALFSSEIAPRWLRTPLAYFVDLGAAVPSVVYGFWGYLVLVPFLRTVVEPALARTTGGTGPFAGPTDGVGVLAAAVVLAVMIVPTIAALSREALRAVPRESREAALAVGATRWEATRIAVLGPATPGIAGAVLLGLGRAIGETIAVALVIGNLYQVPGSAFAQGSTVPSWLLNGFLDSFGLARSSLYELALLLLVISVAVNAGARLLVRRWERPRTTVRGRSIVRRPSLPAGERTLGTPPWLARSIAARGTRLRRRRAAHAVVVALVIGAVALAAWPLASVLETAVANGGTAVLHPSFYVSAPPPPCGVGATACPLGGIGPEIEGTLILVGLAAAVALPGGILVGIYLSEYGRNRLGAAVRFAVDVLVGVPTILVGVFVFALFFRFDRLDDQSAFAGAAALGVVMVPIVARAAELALGSVGASIREGALALGFPRHRVTTRIVLGNCRGALVTGSLLAVMRAAGETAAVVLTAGTSILWVSNLGTPVGALGPFIYDSLTIYASPNYQTDAWGAALVLLLMMALVSLAARLAVRDPSGSGRA